MKIRTAVKAGTGTVNPPAQNATQQFDKILETFHQDEVAGSS